MQQQNVEDFFIFTEKTVEHNPNFQDLNLPLDEGARFLYNLIVFFNTKKEEGQKGSMGCGGWSKKSIFWKNPSGCGSCEFGQKTFQKIFALQKIAYGAPFMEYHGEREFTLYTEALRLYVEHGKEAAQFYLDNLKKEKLAQRAQEAFLKKQEKKQKLTEKVLAKFGEGKKISTENLTAILAILTRTNVEMSWSVNPIALNDDTVILSTKRSYYSSGRSGGTAEYESIIFLYKGQVFENEYQWRDQYDGNKDNWANRISTIQDVQFVENEGVVTVSCVLTSNWGSNRTVSHSFSAVQVASKKVRALESTEFIAFISVFETIKEKMIANLLRLWEYKPKMIGLISGEHDAYYTRPKIVQDFILENGVAVFTTLEQIDHHVFADERQHRICLYLYKHGQSEATLVFSDTKYEKYKEESGPVLHIINAGTEFVTIMTRDGEKVFYYE